MHKIKIPITLSFLTIAALITACSDTRTDSTVSPNDSASTEPPTLATDALGNSFKPIPFPTDLNIPGFKFPEAAVTIDNWVTATPMETSSINLHGWGV